MRKGRCLVLPEGLTRFDPLPASLVVVVGAVTQYPDGHSVPAIPDGERSVAVIDQSGVVESVSPGNVFDSALTDG